MINNPVIGANGDARFVFAAVLPLRSAAPSLRFAILIRLPVQGSPSLANPFSGAKVHWTLAFLRFTLRHHPGSLMKYPG
jgi:hypothetical protein